jgi:peptidoglycan hydrolase-like protein with peptidoglycan-binding domain
MALTNPRFSTNRQLAAAAENKPSLKRGAEGEGVAILQQALIDLGFDMPISTRAQGGLPDGIYGAETDSVVRSFQRQNRLQPDGVAGRQTLQQLEAAIRVLSQVEDAQYRADYVNASRNGGLFA